MKRRTKQILKRIGSGTMAVMLSVALNINPLATLCEVVVDSGIVDKFGNLKDNLIYIAEGHNTSEVLASDEMSPDTTNIDNIIRTISESRATNPSLNDPFPETTEELLNAILGELEQSNEVDYSDVLEEIEHNTWETDRNVATGFRATVQALMGSSNSIHADIKAMHGMIEQHFGIVEQQLAHISEQLDIINDNIDSMQHNYRVAHLYSLNAEFDNSLWRPYTSEVPYVEDFAQVMGQFANVYTGYWDTSITEMNRPGNSAAERALEVLGYDAIVRYEGVVLTNEKSMDSPIGNQTRDYRVSILGDSISTFQDEIPAGYPVFYPEFEVQEKGQTWWSKMIDQMGFVQCANASYSGCYVTPLEGEDALTYSGNDTRIHALKGDDGSNPDIVIVYLGINDFFAGVTDLDEFKQHYGEIIHKIQVAYPSAYTFCCTLPPTADSDYGTEIMNIGTDDEPITYETYNSAIRDVASSYHCPVIDFGTAWDIGENPDNFGDGRVHPNESGMNKLAEKAVAGIEAANVLGKVEGSGSTTVMNKPKGQSGEHESYDITGTQSPTSLAVLVQEFIPEENITWLDAVTVLYKALDQNLYTYQTFMTQNIRITPETSPAYEGFSNIVPDDQGYYNGYDFYMYLNRSNTISGTASNYTVNSIYWTKALNEQFVSRKTDMNSYITGSEFFILATKMMQAYGEPVINQDEIKALLQVYGSQYPVTLGFEVADAWAYLKVRGCLNVDIVPSGYLSRNELLDICMCIKDKDSRSDYKNIDIVLDIGELLRDDGYYPVYDLDFSVGAFSAVDEINYAEMSTYTYLIAKIDGWELGETGMLRVYESPDITSKEVVGASASASILELGESSFYVITLPNGVDPETPQRPAYVAMVNAVTDSVMPGDISWIEIPVSEQIGGIFLGGYTRSGDGIAVVNSEDTYRKCFDYRLADKELISFNDAERSGKRENIYRVSTASNNTIKEKLTLLIDDMFEPNVAYAREDNINISVPSNYGYTNITFAEDGDQISYKEVSAIGSGTIGSLTNSVDLASLNPNVSDPKIRVASSGQTLLLTRLAWAKEVSAISDILNNSGSSVDIGEDADNLITTADFARWYYLDDVSDIINGSGYMSSVNTDLSNKYNALSRIMRNDTTTEKRLLWQGSTGTSVKYSSAEVMTFYALGILPCNQLTKLPDNTTLELISDELKKTESGGSNQYNQDMVNILRQTEWIDANAAIAVTNYSASVTSTGFDADGGFKIFSNNLDAMSDLIGASAMADVEELSQSVASTAIMNRDEQILLSWSDMLAAGIVYPTTDGGAPKIRDDGAYYFMTRNGQVAVNDTKHTIQVGTTIYDLSYKQSNGSSPKLVYIDTEQNNEMYFDVRCVMGMLTASFTRNNTKTIALRRTLGSGEYTTYELGSEGWTSNAVSIKHVLSYNFPEISENEFAKNAPGKDSACTLDILNTSSLDGIEYNDTNGDTFLYWDGSSEAKRLILSSFVPTANWLTVIDDDGAEFKASLFVYYPRIVFEKDGERGGYVNEFEGEAVTVSPPENWDTRWEDLSTKLTDASAIQNNKNIDIRTTLFNYYDVTSLESITEDEWWKLMTIDAIVDLYLLTGKFYISPSYVVREFRITDNSATLVEAWDNYPSVTSSDTFQNGTVSAGEESYFFNEAGNETGAIYWLESIGFVYNMPTVEKFNLDDYFSGLYPLPLAYDANGDYKVNGGIINYNMNYYGMYVDKDGNDVEEIPYGYVLSDKGYIHYKHTDTEEKVRVAIDQLPTIDTGDINGEKPVPYKDPSDPNGMVLAPCGIYYTFGGNAIYSTKVSSINQYNTEVNEFYYGNSRITLNSAQTQQSVSTFNFVSTLYNPVAIKSNTEFHRVWLGRTNEAYISTVGGFERAASDDVDVVMSDDWLPNGLVDWFAELGSNDLITAIDKCSSMLILFAFYVLPIVGIIIMTILVGLSFMSDNKSVQWIVSKTVDPIRILTFGHRNIHTWKWNKVIVPCILLYISFALFLRGNIIRIIMYLANWYDSVMQWARAVF